jgi:SulP family sulfate permease
LRAGYSAKDLVSDLVAGLSISFIAVPLAMAIAIVSDLPPVMGFFTGIVGGFFVSFLSGSKYQVGGPTTVFALTVAAVVATYGGVNGGGLNALILTTLMAGAMMIVFGFCKAGALISFIPYTVVAGFTSGIAVILVVMQINNFFGLGIDRVPPDFLHRCLIYAQHIGSINYFDTGIGVASIVIIALCKKFIPRIPGPIVAVVLFGLISWAMPSLHSQYGVHTIESVYGAIPHSLSSLTPHLPSFSFQMMRDLFPAALTIAILASLESLLSAMVVDGIAGTHHNSNMEITGQGVANCMSVICGGMPVTGALARSSANYQNGAKTPLAGMFQSCWLLLILLVFATFIDKVPLATLAGVMIVVSWNMADVRHLGSFIHAPKTDTAVFFMTMLLTIFVNIDTALLAGIAVASLSFIHKMTESTKLLSVKETANGTMGDDDNDPDSISRKTVPAGVEVYELFGPLFFGIADKVRDTLRLFKQPPKVFILRMRYVPIVDAAGLNALDKLYRNAAKQGTTLVLSGVSPRVYRYLGKAHLLELFGVENVLENIDKALERAKEIVAAKS